MKRIILLFICAICMLSVSVHAQGPRLISGKVSLSDDVLFKAIDTGGGTFSCFVYSFYGKDAADTNLQNFKNFKINARGVPSDIYQDRKEVRLSIDNPEEEFQIEVVNDGYLIVLLEGYEIDQALPRRVTKNMTPPHFKIVPKKTKALETVKLKDVKDTLQNVDITAVIKRGTVVSSRSIEEDGMLFLRIDDLPHACHSRKNSRFIVQPYWLDGPDMGQNKVFAYAAPVVYDYSEYDCTQIRRMDFDKEGNDKLSRFFINDTTYTRIEVKNDTFHLRNYVDTLSGHNPDEAYPYPARAVIAIEDYNERYLIDTIRIDEGERTNYIKFLDFSYEKNLDVNLKDFYEELAMRPMNTPGELKLNFERGKAYLNSKDTMNTRILENARSELERAFMEKTSELLNMQVFGYSSPEGSPQVNRDLARRRADFALNQIKSAIPSHMHGAIKPCDSEILGWDVVADSLYFDGLIEEAKQVREIVEKYPNDLIRQGQAMERLSCYASIIDPIYLPKLRTVKYAYTKRENRKMTSDELIAKFDSGEDKDDFQRANYYHLIQYYWDNHNRKEPETRMRLEEIAKRALVNARKSKEDIDPNDSLYNEGYWALAANILATSYIERDTFDLDILRPFINRSIVVDSIGNKRYAEGLRKIDYFEGTQNIKKYTNFPNFIAEQMIMLLMQPGRKNMEELGQLTDMIESDLECKNDTTYSKLLALANCKRGYYRAGKNCTPERAREIRAIVSDISTTNSVIMNIAMADSEEDEIARAALMEQIYDLPKTAIGNYLRAIIELLRKVPNPNQAAKYLAECFRQDIRKMSIANNDQQLIYNQNKITHQAFGLWEELMKNETYKTTIDMERVKQEGVLDSSKVETKKQQGWSIEDIYADYLIKTSNENHPYYWYEKAINARAVAEDSVLIGYLSKCVNCDPNYLDVIHVARTADVEVSSKGNEKLQKLFEGFYLSELRKRRK